MQLKGITQKLNCLDNLRWLLIAEFVSLFISTALTSIIEGVLFVTVLFCFNKLRDRILLLIRQPVMFMTVMFLVVLCLGMFYGPAPIQEKVRILAGWRRLLLLLLAFLVFYEPLWKERLTRVLIGTATAGAVLSFFGLLGYTPTIVVHNHSTQGMYFAVGAFSAIVLIFYPTRSTLITPSVRYGLGLIAALLTINIIFVNPGRSGYLALLVLAVVASLSLFHGLIRIGLAVGVPLAIILLLSLSPIATNRVTQGIDDMRNYKEEKNITDMGVRMVMWTNTVQIIKERPFFGYGLGGLKEAYREKVKGVAGWQGTVIDDPHNQFLKTTAELGIVGLSVFLMFIWSFFQQGHVFATYRILGLGVLLAWCAASLFSGYFSTSGDGQFLMIWCGAQLAIPSPAISN